ncbi:UNVERIFIED_CONTAM: hypothetical protein BEN50_13875 [Euhalothece sp. KZN 001]
MVYTPQVSPEKLDMEIYQGLSVDFIFNTDSNPIDIRGGTAIGEIYPINSKNGTQGNTAVSGFTVDVDTANENAGLLTVPIIFADTPANNNAALNQIPFRKGDWVTIPDANIQDAVVTAVTASNFTLDVSDSVNSGNYITANGVEVFYREAPTAYFLPLPKTNSAQILETGDSLTGTNTSITLSSPAPEAIDLGTKLAFLLEDGSGNQVTDVDGDPEWIEVVLSSAVAQGDTGIFIDDTQTVLHPSGGLSYPSGFKLVAAHGQQLTIFSTSPSADVIEVDPPLSINLLPDEILTFVRKDDYGNLTITGQAIIDQPALIGTTQIAVKTDSTISELADSDWAIHSTFADNGFRLVLEPEDSFKLSPSPSAPQYEYAVTFYDQSLIPKGLFFGTLKVLPYRSDFGANFVDKTVSGVV